MAYIDALGEDEALAALDEVHEVEATMYDELLVLKTLIQL